MWSLQHILIKVATWLSVRQKRQHSSVMGAVMGCYWHPVAARSLRGASLFCTYIYEMCLCDFFLPFNKGMLLQFYRILPSTCGRHGCVKRCANIAVEVFGVIPLVFRRICLCRPQVNVASSVRTNVTIRGTPRESSWNDWIGFRWMLAGHPRTGGSTFTETSEQNVPCTV